MTGPVNQNSFKAMRAKTASHPVEEAGATRRASFA